MASKETHCQRGHAFDEDNTFITRDGRRKCRACRRINHNSEAYKEKKRTRRALNGENRFKINTGMVQFARMPYLGEPQWITSEY